VPALLVLLALIGVPHPIHSSSAAIRQAPGGQAASIVLRVFGADFPPGRDPVAVARYLAARFRLLDQQGRSVPLRLDRIGSEGTVLLLELSAAMPGGLAGARVWHGVLAERFDDQVNIVQARYANRAVSLLFTAGDGPKPLP
jgi:hypothetical protein